MRAGRCGAEGKRVKAMMMMKTKKVKLYGEKLRKLNTAIHERDNNCCIAQIKEYLQSIYS